MTTDSQADAQGGTKPGTLQALAVYGERRSLVMLSLGFASGLPNLLIFDTLSAWLRDAGLSLEVIAFFGLATLAYSLKFLWAPLVDRMQAPLITNQVEYHPYLSQKTLIETARELGSSITAWSPLAQGKIADDAVIGDIAKVHGKTNGQVTLRWIIQQSVIAIPRTAKESRAAENFDIFDFELSADEMARIHALARPEGRLGDWLDAAFHWDQDS